MMGGLRRSFKNKSRSFYKLDVRPFGLPCGKARAELLISWVMDIKSFKADTVAVYRAARGMDLGSGAGMFGNGAQKIRRDVSVGYRNRINAFSGAQRVFGLRDKARALGDDECRFKGLTIDLIVHTEERL